ncbi:hypothetical protein SAMN04487819_106115 [Actinopolyspora alba]|uniref:Glyoxalase/Bleomycin resistance protein/Dioxygenase superfamily protein n=1 Tax=Actinopolyspora alba TaxID=673379 RepID=A0A1I1WU59_9ACTN|nr:hypothetical protein [Actinopolyspora alba]SFD98734.1 hypothetical protein SAMN04487819_106115 [Actinopolyspora alba]
MSVQEFPAPSEGMLLTHFLTVSHLGRSRAFYRDVVGGRVVLEENPCTLRVANSRLIMKSGGGPTPDKPETTLRPPDEGDPVFCFRNIRVADI